ncbi:MAG: TlpA disulfide reductase family protein [Pseudomonadota bacterium]
MKMWRIALLFLATTLLGSGCSRNESAGAAPLSQIPVSTVASPALSPVSPPAAPPPSAIAANPSPVPSPPILPAVPVPAPTPVRGTGVGNVAPDFRFNGSDGKAVSLSDLRGHPVVINFWATWCGPCQAEMPLLQDLSIDVSLRDKGLVFYAVDIGEKAATVQSFMSARGFTFPVLLDARQDIAEAYNIRAIPATFFIDKDGVIKARRDGAFSNKVEIARELAKIVS